MLRPVRPLVAVALLGLSAGLPASAAAQDRELGACAAVTRALNPDDPVHPVATNAPAARTALAGCGAPGTPTYQLSLAMIESVLARQEAVLDAVAPVLATDPDNAFALRFRCQARVSRGRAAEGLADCDRALARRPDWAAAHHTRGNALQELRRAKDAVAAYRRATELEPRYAYSWNNLGAALEATSDDQGAGRAFFEAFTRFAAESLFARNMTRTGVRLKNYDAAAELMDSVLVRFPGYTVLWFERADLEVLRKRPGAARTFVERALALSPRYAEALVLRGRLKAQDGDRSGASADFQAAAAADTLWAVPHVELATQALVAGGCVAARAPLVEALVRARGWTEPVRLWQKVCGYTPAGLSTLEAAIARAPTAQLRAERAAMPGTLRSAAQRLADWDAVLAAGGRPSADATLGRVKALYELRRFGEAVEMLRPMLQQSTAPALAADRATVHGMLAVLAFAQGDVDGAAQQLNAYETAAADVKRQLDARALAAKVPPKAQVLRLGVLAGLGFPSPDSIGIALLRRNDLRGIDWLLHGDATDEAVDALIALVRSGRVSLATFTDRVRAVAGLPGQGRLRNQDDVDEYFETLREHEYDRGETRGVPYYPDATQAVAAAKRRAAGRFLIRMEERAGPVTREARILAIELERDLPFGTSWASRSLEDSAPLRRLLAADLGLGAGVVELCGVQTAPAFRLTFTKDAEKIIWEYWSRGGMWTGGAQDHYYNPRTRRFQPQVVNIGATIDETYLLDGVLASGGMLRGNSVSLRPCRR